MRDLTDNVTSLLRFLRFLSISAHAQLASASAEGSDWLAAYLRRIGMHNIRVVATKGNSRRHRRMACSSWLINNPSVNKSRSANMSAVPVGAFA